MNRSAEWLGDGGKNGFIARHHLRALGMSSRQFDGRPVIGIADTWSELTPCNAHLRGLAESVRRGFLQAGGVALEFPVLSPGEPFLRPSSMLFRNKAAMELEEILWANPLDAVVVLTGCDKTTSAALMGLASVDLPAIILTGGPMLNGRYPREQCRLRHGHLADDRGTARRFGVAGGVRRIREQPQPLGGPWHDDGHRVVDGLPRRSSLGPPGMVVP
jgi:dihydroxyacid dehydratase/phosphogluconate dehydratase